MFYMHILYEYRQIIRNLCNLLTYNLVKCRGRCCLMWLQKRKFTLHHLLIQHICVEYPSIVSKLVKKKRINN